MTPPELATLKNGYSTPGVAGPRVADKQVSTGSGTIDSIRSFATGPGGLDHVRGHDQPAGHLHAADHDGAVQQYAVTVVSSGGAWQVNDIELSALGNQ